MIATQETDACAPTPDTPSWAHALVLDIIETNLPLPDLARHLGIPFEKLLAHINTPEVQAEINAYEELVRLRARLVGQTARPISIRKMLEVLETPTPRPLGRDPESDQRALHRHADLIRRTAAVIARESRALAPKPTSPRTKSRTQPTPPNPSNTVPGGAALQSGVNHPDTSFHERTNQDITPDGSALKRSVPGGSALQSDLHRRDNSLHQNDPHALDDTTRSAADSDPDHAAQVNADQRASSLLAVAGSTRARDHPRA
jgi:hypothetical protein